MKAIKVIRVVLALMLAVLIPLFLWSSCRTNNIDVESLEKTAPNAYALPDNVKVLSTNLSGSNTFSTALIGSSFEPSRSNDEMIREPKIEPGPKEELEEIKPVVVEPEKPVIDPNTPRLLRPCGYTVEQLEKGLLKNLKQHAATFLEAEKETGVNALFLCSIAAQESGWGTSYLAVNNNNFFGWKRTTTRFRHFDSPEEGIMTVARGIKKNYLTETGSCFNGWEIKDIAIMYCGGNQHWVKIIDDIMGQIDRRINA